MVFEWTDKKDDADDIMANDINIIAHEVILQGNTKADKTALSELQSEIDSKADATELTEIEERISNAELILSNKADKEDLEELQSEIDSKADTTELAEVLERLQYYGDASITPSPDSYFTFTTDSSSKTASIVLEDTVDKPTVTSVVIPYEYIGEDDVVYSVTTIGTHAFFGCTSLTSVTIPNSVTTIGNEAFHNCTSLTSVTIPNSVTTIGTCAFQDCTSLTSVNILNSVTTIGTRAFAFCARLTSVNIPNSVTTIGNEAFHSCASLTSVTIPNSVTTIGEGAFAYCTSLKSVTIPNSVTTIEEGAFAFFDEDGNDIANPNVTVICEQGSYAETYCIENGIKYVYDTIDSDEFVNLQEDVNNLYNVKADKTHIEEDTTSTSIEFQFSEKNVVQSNYETLNEISFVFSDGGYAVDYSAGLNFTAGDSIIINYPNSGIINWRGVDCALVDGKSVFSPVAGKRYNIIFFFEGKYFVGYVDGFIPATQYNQEVAE